MTQRSAQFRRPAMLEPQVAEKIVGGDDPAKITQLARDAAQALVHLNQGRPVDDEKLASGILRLVGQSGPDMVAEIWDSAPRNSLGGALWRLYLLGQWLKRKPDQVDTCWRLATTEAESGAGEVLLSGAVAGVRVSALSGAEERETCGGEDYAIVKDADVKVLSPQQLLGRLDELMSGKFSGDLTQLLMESARFLAFLALAGTKYWIADMRDELAFDITRRQQAFAATAKELQAAAMLYAAGRL